MSDSISAREFRKTAKAVLRRVEGGERVTVTVDRRPVAELVPLRSRRIVSYDEALRVASRHPADRALLADLRLAFPETTDDV